MIHFETTIVDLSACSESVEETERAEDAAAALDQEVAGETPLPDSGPAVGTTSRSTALD